MKVERKVMMKNKDGEYWNFILERFEDFTPMFFEWYISTRLNCNDAIDCVIETSRDNNIVDELIILKNIQIINNGMIIVPVKITIEEV